MQGTEVPRRSLKERQRQEREELILQTSEEVLLEKGYSDTSMDEIAARVGIAKGTLYLHFSGKEDLVIALFERDMLAFLQVVEKSVASDAPIRKKLETILRSMYKGVLGKRHMQLLSLLMEGIDIRKQLLAKKDTLRHLRDRIIVAITSLLEEGKAAGEFDKNIPTSVMVSTFFTLLPPKGATFVTEELPSDILINHLIHFYFKGIAAI
jgi:AcrR family transcriptional regulator